MPPRDSSEAVQVAFGRALRKERSAAEISQEQLALQAGIDRVYVSEIERGLKCPTLRVVFKLAEVLGIRASALVAGTERALRRR